VRNPWRIIPRLYSQWASAEGEGMTLELIEADETGEIIEGGLCPVATIVADDEEVQWLEIYPEEGIVRIPLTEVITAIELSRKGVHGEKHYDRFREDLREDT